MTILVSMPKPKLPAPMTGSAFRNASFNGYSQIPTRPSMKALLLFHDDWYQYIKADLMASQFRFAAFMVIRRKRAWWGKYLWKRSQRLGPLKVMDELALRAYWQLVKSPRG